VPTHLRPLGYVFQDGRLFAHLTVRGNLDYGMRRAFRRTAGADSRGFDSIVELLGLGPLLERFPERLSGGEQQRVAIARALLTAPRLLLLDEPLAALDHARKQEILPYLERLRDELEIPVIHVSHAADEVARLADHIVVMEDGHVLTQGPLAETLARVDLPIRLGEDAGAVFAATVAERDAEWHLARVDLRAATPTPASGCATAATRSASRVRVRILARDVSLIADPPRATAASRTCCPARSSRTRRRQPSVGALAGADATSAAPTCWRA
jgi:molybdate transport system ATP-binding protein